MSEKTCIFSDALKVYYRVCAWLLCEYKVCFYKYQLKGYSGERTNDVESRNNVLKSKIPIRYRADALWMEREGMFLTWLYINCGYTFRRLLCLICSRYAPGGFVPGVPPYRLSTPLPEISEEGQILLEAYKSMYEAKRVAAS